jgi:hypothetical protein
MSSPPSSRPPLPLEGVAQRLPPRRGCRFARAASAGFARRAPSRGGARSGSSFCFSKCGGKGASPSPAAVCRSKSSRRLSSVKVVEVHEHPPAALLLPPGARRLTWHAPLHLTRERERGVANLGEVPVRFEPDIDVDASRRGPSRHDGARRAVTAHSGPRMGLGASAPAERPGQCEQGPGGWERGGRGATRTPAVMALPGVDLEVEVF